MYIFQICKVSIISVSMCECHVQFLTVNSSVNNWMSASRLRFNPTKTEIMWLCAGHLLQQVDISDIPVLSSTVRVVQSARDLGVILDSQLSLSAHIAALCRSGFLSVAIDSTSYPVTHT